MGSILSFIAIMLLFEVGGLARKSFDKKDKDDDDMYY